MGGSSAGADRPAALSPGQAVQLVRMKAEINPATGRIWSIRELAAFYKVGASTVVRTLDKHAPQICDETGCTDVSATSGGGFSSS